MKLYRVNGFILFVLFMLACNNSSLAQSWISVQDTAGFNPWKSIITEAKEKYAPDSRSVYFQVYDDKDKHGSYIIETTSNNTSLYLERQRKDSKTLPFSVKLLPDSELRGQVKGVINLSVANLRTKPSHSAEMATQALLGTPVDVLKKVSGFYLVRTPEGYLAWVDSYGLSLKSDADMNSWVNTEKAIFIDDFGHSFKEPDEASPRVSDLVLGNILHVSHKGDSFWQVEYPDGRKAYVLKSQLSNFGNWKNKTKPTAEGIIDVAKKMMGVPYLWGGTSIKGVDCSGFTKTSYFMNGIIIPRDASQQASVGLGLDIMEDSDLNIEKALANLQKGDLIFFSASKGKNPKQPITHVAIYMENGNFIHAAGIVRINSFIPDAENYDRQSLTIVGARRYLGNEGFVPMNSISSIKGY